MQQLLFAGALFALIMAPPCTLDAAEGEPSFSRPDGAELLFVAEVPASAQNPLYATDSSRLAFTLFHQGYNDGPAGIYLFTTGSAPSALIDEAGQDCVNLPGSAWNAATNRIVFSSDRAGREEIWTIQPDGTDLTRITAHSDDLYFIEPSFSPDGQWIVFEADQGVPDDRQQGSVWKVRSDGTGLTKLTDGPAGGTDDRQPNWSPAGDLILFQRRAPGSEDWNVFTMAPDGSGLFQVTTGPFSDTDASWSPDGAWIVYSSDHGGLERPSIFVIPVSGGEPLRVTSDPSAADGAPCWSPDGSWIAFESHQDDEDPASLWLIAAPFTPGDCALLCTAAAPAETTIHVPAAFSATATPVGTCTGSVVFDWDFGDGSAHSSDQSPLHTYTQQGTYAWRLTAAVDSATCTRPGSILVHPPVTPPAISGVTRLGNPFRLRLSGANFQSGIEAFIGSDEAPWGSVTRKSDSLVVLKGGASLKARFPAGQPVTIEVVNPDGGAATATYTRP